MFSIDQKLITEIKDICRAAGGAIMEVYESDDFAVETKENDSPLTRADMASHHLIVERLGKLENAAPVVSEEATEEENQAALNNGEYWLVDPLDGTKEFIKRSGEFTVNIALMQNHEPVLGVIYVPVQDVMYWGYDNEAWRQTKDEEPVQIQTSQTGTVEKAVASKSHYDEKTAAFLEQFGDIELVQAGSSLKICRVAEGEAQIYPRFLPTMEWDTAAGDAILRAAVGKITDLHGNVLQYNKAGLKNPGFAAMSNSLQPTFPDEIE